MAKSKDPAFLFYPSDFIMGTYTMTDEQVGKYIRLLCLQFSKGGKLTERELLSINRDNDPYVTEKFMYEDGFYFNKRLKEVVEEREAKAMVNRENGKKGGNPNFEKGKDNPYYNRIDNQMVMSIDNRNDKRKINITLENENINELVNKDEFKDDLKESIKIIIDYLNLKTNKHFKHTTDETVKFVSGRLNEKYTLEQFQYVIDVKCEEWLGTDQEKYLTPSTLFRPANFEKYVNQKRDVKKQMNDWAYEQFKKTGDLL